MARGVNKVILIGNLGADPEYRATASGSGVTNVRLATSEAWRDRQSGEQQERTEWHRVVFFGKLADIANQYLRKGSKVYVEGSIRTRKWQGQDGQDRYTTEIVANEMQMLDGRGGGDAGGGGGSWDRGGSGGGGTGSDDWGGGGGQSRKSSGTSEPPPDFDPDDDIPF